MYNYVKYKLLSKSFDSEYIWFDFFVYNLNMKHYVMVT